jgi:hypothetical protein
MSRILLAKHIIFNLCIKETVVKLIVLYIAAIKCLSIEQFYNKIILANSKVVWGLPNMKQTSAV